MLLNIPKAAPAARIIQPQMKGGGTEAHGYQGWSRNRGGNLLGPAWRRES